MKNKLFFIYIIFLFNSSFAQNGKILSKNLIDITKTPIWKQISVNDTLNNDFKHLKDLNFYFITYKSDSLKVVGITVEPKKEGVYPAIIFNRGGNRNYGRLTVGTLIMYTSKLAAQGYIIIGSNFRKEDEFGGAEINDVLCLTETIKEIKNCDTTRIGMFGWSRGGITTYQSLRKTNKIKTAIIGNGVSDLFSTIKERPEMEFNPISECIPNYWNNKEAELKKRSAIYWADELNKKSSLLILCGTEDKHVNYSQAERMASELEKINYKFELLKFDTDHFFTGKREVLDELVINWFNENLK
jgi:dipeptidyl aminopeptidase/acylaminoacyl peptidase